MRNTLLAAVASLALMAPLAGCATTNKVDSFSAPAGAPTRAPIAIAPRTLGPVDDYRIGVRDILALRVYELEKVGEVASLDLEVNGDGRVAVPFVGLVPASGSTVMALRIAITEALGARYLVDPQVMLAVKEYRSREISVTGNVAKPGSYFLNRNRVSLVDALALAGGLTKDAGTRAIVVRPKASSRSDNASENESIEVDLLAAIVDRDPMNDFDIEPGMVVQVPAAEEFFVMGYVKKPGAFPYQGSVTVLQAIAIAGGLDAYRASPSVVLIKRESTSGVEVLQVDVEEIARGEAPDIPILPGDSIEAGRTAGWAIVSDVLESIKGVFGIGFAAGTL